MQQDRRRFSPESRKGKSSVVPIIMISLGVVFCIGIVMQFMDAGEQENIINETVSLFDAGQKEKALTCLQRRVFSFSDEQRKKLNDAVMSYVDRKAANHEYKDAIDTLNDDRLERVLEYSSVRNARYTKLDEVREKYITYSVSKNDYRTAINLLQARGNLLTAHERTQLHEILTEYVLKESEAGEITDSVKFFRESWPEGKDVITPALSKYTDKITAEISALSSPDYELARAKGSKLDCVDLQLQYCHELYKLSYDIKQVYPDGVEVGDTDLGKYYITNIINNTSGRDIKFSPMIIFSREQKSMVLTIDLESIKPKYSVRLLAGEMFRHGAEFAAKSFAEAESLLLADAVYIDIGTVTEIKETTIRRKDDRTVFSSRTTSRDLSIYSAVNNLAMYSVKDPSKGVVMIMDSHDPQAANEEWLAKQYKSLYDWDRLGTFDSTKVMENLDRVIDFSYMYRDAERNPPE